MFVILCVSLYFVHKRKKYRKNQAWGLYCCLPLSTEEALAMLWSRCCVVSWVPWLVSGLLTGLPNVCSGSLPTCSLLIISPSQSHFDETQKHSIKTFWSFYSITLFFSINEPHESVFMTSWLKNWIYLLVFYFFSPYLFFETRQTGNFRRIRGIWSRALKLVQGANLSCTAWLTWQA